MLKINVKNARMNKKLTQDELAKLSGFSQPYIAELESENCKKNPTLKLIERIAKALDVCPKDLIECKCERCLDGE